MKNPKLKLNCPPSNYSPHPQSTRLLLACLPRAIMYNYYSTGTSTVDRLFPVKTCVGRLPTSRCRLSFYSTVPYTYTIDGEHTVDCQRDCSADCSCIVTVFLLGRIVAELLHQGVTSVDTTRRSTLKAKQATLLVHQQQNIRIPSFRLFPNPCTPSL